MFFGVFRFAKNLKLLNKGGIQSISRSSRGTFMVYRFSLVEMTGDDNSAADTVS